MQSTSAPFVAVQGGTGPSFFIFLLRVRSANATRHAIKHEVEGGLVGPYHITFYEVRTSTEGAAADIVAFGTDE